MKSWTSTGYFSKSANSLVTSSRFSPFIGPKTMLLSNFRLNCVMTNLFNWHPIGCFYTKHTHTSKRHIGKYTPCKESLGFIHIYIEREIITILHVIRISLSLCIRLCGIYFESHWVSNFEFNTCWGLVKLLCRPHKLLLSKEVNMQSYLRVVLMMYIRYNGFSSSFHSTYICPNMTSKMRDK